MFELSSFNNYKIKLANNESVTYFFVLRELTAINNYLNN